MKKYTLGAIALFAIAGTAFGQTTASTFSFNEPVTVQQGGPRPATSGDRFFNIQGSGNGSFASWGAVRFDISGIRAQFDADFGAGNWTIQSVGLDLWAATAGFTASGNVGIYHSSDDTTVIDGSASDSSLRFDNAYAPGGNSGTTGLDGGLDRGSQLSNWFFPINGDQGDFQLPQVPLALNGDLVNDILNDNLLTLTLEALDPNVSATLKGDSFQGIEPPRIVITAVPAPGAAALLGVAGLAAARRRRA